MSSRDGGLILSGTPGHVDTVGLSEWEHSNVKKGGRSPRHNVESELTREQILTAAENALRRYGPMKTTVVDIATALGVSHGSVYRHFESKVALRAAVVEVWLQRFTTSLEKVARKPGSARVNLRLWLDTLRELKTSKFKQEVELVETYHQLVNEPAHVVDNYYHTLTGQVEMIIGAGIASGEFGVPDAGAAARAIIEATTRFHHPWHAAFWQSPGIDEAFEGVWDLILRGLTNPNHPSQAAGQK